MHANLSTSSDWKSMGLRILLLLNIVIYLQVCSSCFQKIRLIHSGPQDKRTLSLNYFPVCIGSCGCTFDRFRFFYSTLFLDHQVLCTERYTTKYTRSAKVQISSGMNDVTDVICTLLLCKYPSIDAVYEYSVPCLSTDSYRELRYRKFGFLQV